MWAGHVHDHSIWASLIRPLRNKVVHERDQRVDIPWDKSMSQTKREKGYVPFGNVLLRLEEYLDVVEKAHRWPVEQEEP